MRGSRNSTRSRPGYALLAVLMVIVVLSLAAYRFTDAMGSEYAVAVRTTEAAQAKIFAASGVNYVAGVLSDPAALQSQLNNNPYTTTAFNGIAVGPAEAARGGGRFSLIYPGDSGNGSGIGRFVPMNGVMDETSKWNLNALAQARNQSLLHDVLMKLPNMTEEVADAIGDWLDADDTPRTAGAESDYYQGLNPPYRAKNGPINTIDELLLVRGVTPELLFGSDRNRNGRIDTGEVSGDSDLGWSAFLTCYGRELNVTAVGAPRVYVNNPLIDGGTLLDDLKVLQTQELIDYVVAARLYGTRPIQGQGGSNNNRQRSAIDAGEFDRTLAGLFTNPLTELVLLQPPPGGGGRGGQGGGRGQGGSGPPGGGGRGGEGGGPPPGMGRGGEGGGPPPGMGRGPRGEGGEGGPPGGERGNRGGRGGPGGVPGAGGGDRGGGGGAGGTVTGGAAELRAAVQKSIGDGARLRSRIRSLPGLVGTQVTLPRPRDAEGNPPTIIVPSPLNDPAKLTAMLPVLLDMLTTSEDYELTPRVNVMTAPREVLLGLPGLTESEVDQLLSARAGVEPTSVAANSGAWMVTVGQLPIAKFTAVLPYITGRTMTYRVQSVGYFGRGGPVARAEAVIDANPGHPRVLYYRDISDLGRGGFELAR